jgi:hypothetical protein
MMSLVARGIEARSMRRFLIGITLALLLIVSIGIGVAVAQWPHWKHLVRQAMH